jgi:hypothetical protein
MSIYLACADTSLLAVQDRNDAHAPRAAAAPAENTPKSRRGKGRSGGGGDAVVGMGEHMPGFIAKSFEERLSG